jgi:hypothetical protein
MIKPCAEPPADMTCEIKRRNNGKVQFSEIIAYSILKKKK